MTALIPIKHGEVLPPGEGVVTVIGNRSLFGVDRVIMAAPAGLTIAEMIEAAWAGQPRPPVAVWLYRHAGGPIGEAPVPEPLWARVRPKPGTVVAFKATAQGRMARTIALIAVAAVALIASAGMLAPVIGAVLGPTVGALFAAGTIGAGLLGAAITIGGMMLVNTLFPVQQPQVAPAIDADQVPSLTSDTGVSSTRKTLYSLAGANNQARRFGSIPVVLGTHRISPPYLAQPYSEIVGDEMYLRVGFCAGYGPLELSNFRIGETLLSSFSDVEQEWRYGYSTDAALTLIPWDMHQDDLNIRLEYAINNVRRTPPETEHITIEITAPQGIYRINATTGAQEAFQVTISFFYREINTSNYTTITHYTFAIEPDTKRVAFTAAVPRGQYDVLVFRQTTMDDDTRVADEVYWTVLRSINFQSPHSFDAPLSLVGLRMRATGQLNGTLDTFNCVASSLVKRYNGSTGWIDNQKSSNPADLFRYVLQGRPNKRPVPDEQIDFVALQEWWHYCNANGFTYNGVIESAQSVYGLLANVASAGRAVPSRPDGRWSVMWERFDEPIAQHFSPRNSWGFVGQKVFKRMPHALRVRFINAAIGYQADELMVYDDGYDQFNATIFESVEFPGVTDADLAWKHGRYQIAQARLRPEVYTLQCDFEHLRCNRNSRVRVLSDVAGWGQIAFRVIAVDGEFITIDEVVTMQPVPTVYVARFRLKDGTSVIFDVVYDDGEHTTIELTGGPGEAYLPQVGDLGFFGGGGTFSGAAPESVVLRILSIEHMDDLSARLTLVDDAPDIQFADTGPIPPFDSFITLPVDPYHLPPLNLQVSEVVDPTKTNVRVRFSWSAPRLAGVLSFEAEAINGSFPGFGPSPPPQTGELPPPWGTGGPMQVYSGGPVAELHRVNAPQQFTDFLDRFLGEWSFRVRSMFTNKTFSAWTVLDRTQITGVTLLSPPLPVDNLRAVFRDRVIYIDWDEREIARNPTYEIRKGPTAEGGLFIISQAHPPFPTQGDDIYWVAAVVTPIIGTNLYSPWQSVTVQGAQLVRNVVVEYDESALGWPGTFSGNVQISGPLIRTGGAGNILGITDFLAEPDIINYGGGGEGTYEIPSNDIVDQGRIAEAAIAVDLAASGASTSQNILIEPDFLALPDLFDVAAARNVQVYAEISVALNDPTPATSSTALTIGTGSKVFTVQAGLSYQINEVVRATNIGTGFFMEGPVTAYVGTSLTVNVTLTSGSGTFALWNFTDPAWQWTLWERWSSGVKRARAIKLRLQLLALTGDVYAYVSHFSYTIDVPDRIDHYNFTTSVGGTNIIFVPDNQIDAAPFNGGPGMSLVPFVGGAMVSPSNGDRLILGTPTLTTVNVQVVDAAGAGVARPVAIAVQGY